MERPASHLVRSQFNPKFWKDGSTVGQVAEVLLERCESSDPFPLQPEGRNSAGDALFGFRDHVKDCLAQIAGAWSASARQDLPDTG